MIEKKQSIRNIIGQIGKFMDEKGTKTVNDWKGKKLHSLYLVLGAFFVKIGTIIGKIVTLLDKIGTLWGKIGTLMSKKRTNILCWSLGMMAEREPKGKLLFYF